VLHGFPGISMPRDKRIRNRWFSGASSEKLAPRPSAASSVQRVFFQRRKGSRCIQTSQPKISPSFSSTLPNLKSPTLKHIGALPSQHPRDKWIMIGPWSSFRRLINLRAAAVPVMRPELIRTILFIHWLCVARMSASRRTRPRNPQPAGPGVILIRFCNVALARCERSSLSHEIKPRAEACIPSHH